MAVQLEVILVLRRPYKKFVSASTGTMCGVTWKSVVAYVIPVLHANVPENALEEDYSCIIGSSSTLDLTIWGPSTNALRSREKLILQFVRDCVKYSPSTKPGQQALHPQSDGMVERFNRTILNSLSLLASNNQQDWDNKLPIFLLAATGVRSRDLRLPADLLCSAGHQMHPWRLRSISRNPGMDGGNTSFG
ncbi:hypothetical protein TNCV_113181 [Trichonephila clavipes]|nr:hypothetical protein TNCV_113181 [Trichonephila clavipes]